MFFLRLYHKFDKLDTFSVITETGFLAFAKLRTITSFRTKYDFVILLHIEGVNKYIQRLIICEDNTMFTQYRSIFCTNMSTD